MEVPYRKVSALYLVEREKNENSTYDKSRDRLHYLADKLGIELPELQHPEEWEIWINRDSPTSYVLSLTLDYWQGWSACLMKV